MRIKFNKEIEFFFKKLFFSETYLLKKKIERLILNNKNKEEEELSLIKDLIQPGTDVIDVGVYQGIYSYEMAKYSRIVHSFEPNPIIYDYLNRNLKKIIRNMKLYNFALSDNSKKAYLKVPIRNKKSNKNIYENYYKMGRATIHKNNFIESYEKFIVQTKKIDDIDLNFKVSLIKIDVEGHEMEVIRGATNLIKKYHPTLIVEIEEKYSKNSVKNTIEKINSLGYEAFFLEDSVLKSVKILKNFNLYRNFIFKKI